MSSRELDEPRLPPESPNKPLYSLDDLRAISGLELMQRALATSPEGRGLTRLLGLVGVHIEAGAAAFRSSPGPDHTNPMGGVHGGYIATLLDTAMGCAAHSVCETGVSHQTLEIKVNYLRPVAPKGQQLRCEAKVLFAGKTSIFTEAQVLAEDGKVLAHATATFAKGALPGAPSSLERQGVSK